MRRNIATLPDSVSELALIRLGIQARGWRALWFAAKLGKAIDRAVAEALKADTGLLHSERFTLGRGHFGLLQYWRSFEELEAWSRQAPHSDWWRDALARIRTRGDFGIYHESYLVPRERVESIYMECDSVGLSAFGKSGEPVGPATTSRGRLGLGKKLS
ncbi:phenylacetaldoxime dehydratase family protein [Singulisphaera sp. PoT]|uniref:phenylacetaldoxime dehydratase family protein n=1 Tax=Singulisphaera sp. PoT TaxID=3411797 RepID=UPI003BF52494